MEEQLTLLIRLRGILLWTNRFDCGIFAEDGLLKVEGAMLPA